jgi:hypothetical protein
MPQVDVRRRERGVWPRSAWITFAGTPFRISSATCLWRKSVEKRVDPIGDRDMLEIAIGAALALNGKSVTRSMKPPHTDEEDAEERPAGGGVPNRHPSRSSE